MTKIGEGKDLPQKSVVERAHHDLEHNASKFLNALEGYRDANAEDKEHLKVVMDQSLELIHAAVREIKQAGINKQEVQVEKDYKEYISTNSPEKFAQLEEDLSTLRDYNKLP